LTIFWIGFDESPKERSDMLCQKTYFTALHWRNNFFQFVIEFILTFMFLNKGKLTFERLMINKGVNFITGGPRP